MKKLTVKKNIAASYIVWCLTIVIVTIIINSMVNRIHNCEQYIMVLEEYVNDQDMDDVIVTTIAYKDYYGRHY